MTYKKLLLIYNQKKQKIAGNNSSGSKKSTPTSTSTGAVAPSLISNVAASCLVADKNALLDVAGPSNVELSNNSALNADNFSYANVARSFNSASRKVANNISVPAIVGTKSSSSDELSVVHNLKKKWFHLSSFKNSVSSDNIIAYVCKYASLDKSHIACYKLVKKDANVADLKFVNFKIGISEPFAEKLLDSALWPEHVVVRPFNFLEKKRSIEHCCQLVSSNINTNSSLRIFFQNAGGIRTKNNIIFIESSHSLYDVFVFAETWLNSNFSDAEFFNPSIFNVFRKDRDVTKTGCTRGGGVLIAIKKHFKASQVILTNNDTLLDQLCVAVMLTPGSTMYLVVSYIPPNSSFSLYKSHVDNILDLENSSSSSAHLCVFGDFNLNSITWTSKSDTQYMEPTSCILEVDCYLIDNLFGLNLRQINNLFNTLGKLLDLIFVSNNLNFSLCAPLVTFLTCDMHHRPVELFIELYSFNCSVNTNTSLHKNCKLNFKLGDYNLLNTLLLDINWNSKFCGLDLNDCFSVFTSTVNSICNRIIPPKRVSKSKVPWHNKWVNKLKNLRNKYFRRYKLSGSSTNEALYKFYMRKLNAYSKFLHNQYINRIECNIKLNPKLFWNFIKSKKSQSDYPSTLHYKSCLASNSIDSANLFAEFFKSNYVDNCCVSNFRHNVNSPIFNCGSLAVCSDEVCVGIQNLTTTMSVDLDGFCSYFLKQCSLAISAPLSYIFNLSLKSGIFLDCWKSTLICPIFKKGNKSDIENYRPISKLSNISKLFESIIKSKLVFLTNNSISVNQHGFVSGRSTVTNLVAFTKFCYNSFNADSQVDVVYTDFSKAFDHVSHELLLTKLFNFGFHSSLLRWFKSYLCDRRCTVVVDGCFSDSFVATSGVPQGSILGPLLFILFINDIGDCFHYSNFLLYADDLKIFKEVQNLNDSSLLQADLDRLSTWCIINNLYLNVSKCFHMNYCRVKNPLRTTYSIDNCLLTKLSHISDLGVVFDSKLSFNQHINVIIPKAFSALSFLKRHCCKFKDLYTLKCLYSSLVRSKLEYAAIIWNPSYSIHIRRLERVQNVFTKFALKCIKFSDESPPNNVRNLLIGLSSLEQRRTFLSVLFLHDVISGKVNCSVILEAISFLVPSRLLRHSNIFFVPRPRSIHASSEPLVRVMALVNALAFKFDFDFCVSKQQFRNLLIDVFNSRS